jgi:hypothetical protein
MYIHTNIDVYISPLDALLASIVDIELADFNADADVLSMLYIHLYTFIYMHIHIHICISIQINIDVYVSPLDALLASIVDIEVEDFNADVLSIFPFNPTALAIEISYIALISFTPLKTRN